MRYLDHVEDCGIVLSPDAPGEAYYEWDGGGIREAICTSVDGVYYLSYDGAMPGGTHESYWNACQARSTDLVHWEKCGTNMKSSALTHPEGTWEVYKDFCSASSPWSFYDNGVWYHYYVGADHCAPDGTPAFRYSTLLATSDILTGEWRKRCDQSGCEKHVCFPTGAPGVWDDETASPGQVLINPAYAAGKAGEKKYLMIYSGSCSGVCKRSLGIARTDDLAAADDFDRPAGHFWQKDPEPILPPAHDIENSSVFYEEESGLYWLFTNHIYGNAYTDAVWVYWSKDPTRWDPECRAVVVDAGVSTWAKGAIGMPSVVRLDADTLALLYDGVKGEGTGHLHRHIGLAKIRLPLCLKPEKEESGEA